MSPSKVLSLYGEVCTSNKKTDYIKGESCQLCLIKQRNVIRLRHMGNGGETPCILELGFRLGSVLQPPSFTSRERAPGNHSVVP
jgi:hypothetical protein